MPGINKVILVGHLGKAPEFKKLSNNAAFLRFPLATTEIELKDGEKSEHTEWHNIIMWRGIAEAGRQLLKKGMLVYITGNLKTRSYVDKTDVAKYMTEVTVENFSLLGRESDFEESYPTDINSL